MWDLQFTLLNDVLIRFRKHPYVLITDISKMYRAVGLDPNMIVISIDFCGEIILKKLYESTE